jgi:hypothetical protein
MTRSYWVWRISASCILAGKPARELGEGTRKSGFGGHLRGAVPAAEAAQLVVALQALNEMASAGQIVNSLGEEGAGERAAIAERAARVGAPAFHKARQRL